MHYVYYNDYKKTVTFRRAPSTQHGSLIGKIEGEIGTPAFTADALLRNRNIHVTGLTVTVDDSPLPIENLDP